MGYKVEWENEVGDRKGGPLEAAKDCLYDLQNREALGFTITDLKTGRKYSVDLNEEDEDAVLEITENQ